jgi:hypothetical protein
MKTFPGNFPEKFLSVVVGYSLGLEMFFLFLTWALTPLFSGKVLLASIVYKETVSTFSHPVSFTIPLGNHKNSLHRPRRRTSFSRAPPP